MNSARGTTRRMTVGKCWRFDTFSASTLPVVYTVVISMSGDSETPPATRLPTAIWALGFVSLLMDVSSEMVHSLLPVFLVTAVGASGLVVGVIEGLAEALALVVKVFSGALSDYWGKRKGLAVLGYGLGALSKPLFALASGAGLVLVARLIDRTGKGIRGAPRDALIADIAPAAMRGAAFGLRQSLDSVGAFLGPLLAVGLMLLWANDFQAVFWVAVIPGLLSVLVLVLGVQEPVHHHPGRGINPIRRDSLRLPDPALLDCGAAGNVFCAGPLQRGLPAVACGAGWAGG